MLHAKTHERLEGKGKGKGVRGEEERREGWRESNGEKKISEERTTKRCAEKGRRKWRVTECQIRTGMTKLCMA